jgi:hypothetical protein
VQNWKESFSLRAITATRLPTISMTMPAVRSPFRKYGANSIACGEFNISATLLMSRGEDTPDLRSSA